MKIIERRIIRSMDRGHEFLLKEDSLLDVRVRQPGWPENTKDDPDYRDSAQQEHLRLKAYLLKTLPKVPGSLNAPIHIEGGVFIASSSDGKIRSWAWDTDLGGTMPVVYLIVEYLTSKGIRIVDLIDSSEEGNPCTWYDTIYVERDSSDRVTYLPHSITKASSCLVGEDIEAWRLDDTGLRMAIPLFQTPKKLLSSIGIEYNYFTNYEGYENHIRLSPDGKQLFIPVVRPYHKDGCGDHMTNKSLRYEFDGEHFVYKGIAK